MPPVHEIADYMQRLAPLDLAESWDNVGLLIGSGRQPVRRVMTCLTITPDSVAEAVQERVDLIVVHHPFPFQALKRFTDDTPVGRLLLQLIEAKISVYSAHTAYDSAARGINQQLAETIGCLEIRPLVPVPTEPTEAHGAARFGIYAEPKPVAEVVAALRQLVGPCTIRMTAGETGGGALPTVSRIAVACGSAGSFLEAAWSKQCDTLVLGETSFHTCLDAQARGVRLILLGHYASERFAMTSLAERLAQQFAEVTVWASRRETDPLVNCPSS